MRNPLRRTHSTRQAPDPPAATPGTREFAVTILAPDRAVAIEAAKLPVQLGWAEAVSALLGAVNVPTDATAYRLLDVAAGSWIDRPTTVAEVGPREIGLIHEFIAAEHDDPVGIAQMVRDNPPA